MTTLAILLHRTAFVIYRSALAIAGPIHRLAQRITYREAMQSGAAFVSVGEYARTSAMQHPSAQRPTREEIVDPVERHEISDQAAEIIRRVFGEDQACGVVGNVDRDGGAPDVGGDLFGVPPDRQHSEMALDVELIGHSGSTSWALLAVWLGVAAWRTWRHPRPGPWAPPPGGRR